MAGKYYVILLLALISGCAQVGSISGGPRDETAPKPITDQMMPPNATTNYSGNTFVIPFDEYFTLNNPAQTVRMVPPHATVSAEMKKKTLYLSWEDTLEANTTYAIYLNGTVKDLTEGNDTTLQLVFSTGDVLDSTTYTVAVTDAFTGEPLSDITVALFDPQTDRLKSFAKSEKGVAQLNYLSPGEYRMVAFEDENLDYEIQPEERVGFPDGGKITVDSNFFDSIPIRTFEPFPKQRYKVKSFIPPGAFELESNAPIQYCPLQSVKINGKEAPFHTNTAKTTYYLVSPDTLGGSLADIAISHSTDTMDVLDTLTYRFRNKEREKPIKLKPIHTSSIAPGESLVYELYCEPTNLLDSLFEFRSSEDSTLISDYMMVLDLHQVLVRFDETVSGEVDVLFKKGFVQTPFGATETFSETVQLNTLEDYGILNVDLSGYTQPIVLELLRANKVEKTLAISDPSTPLKLEMLTPDTYTFRVLRDTNGNGYWDPGVFKSLTQPELVDSYSKPIKVRANWEVEVTLNPNENE